MTQSGSSSHEAVPVERGAVKEVLRELFEIVLGRWSELSVAGGIGGETRQAKVQPPPNLRLAHARLSQ